MTLVVRQHFLPKIVAQSQINQLINPFLTLPNQIIPNKSSQLYLLNIHRSQQIHIPHLNDYPLTTTQSPQVEVSNNSFTWIKKNNNLTKQSLTHLHLLLLHTPIHLIRHQISIPWNQHSPFPSQKYKFTNLFHNPLSQPLYTTIYIINKVYGPEIGYSNITPSTQD